MFTATIKEKIDTTTYKCNIYGKEVSAKLVVPVNFSNSISLKDGQSVIVDQGEYFYYIIGIITSENKISMFLDNGNKKIEVDLDKIFIGNRDNLSGIAIDDVIGLHNFTSPILGKNFASMILDKNLLSCKSTDEISFGIVDKNLYRTYVSEYINPILAITNTEKLRNIVRDIRTDTIVSIKDKFLTILSDNIVSNSKKIDLESNIINMYSDIKSESSSIDIKSEKTEINSNLININGDKINVNANEINLDSNNVTINVNGVKIKINNGKIDIESGEINVKADKAIILSANIDINNKLNIMNNSVVSNMEVYARNGIIIYGNGLLNDKKIAKFGDNVYVLPSISHTVNTSTGIQVGTWNGLIGR